MWNFVDTPSWAGDIQADSLVPQVRSVHRIWLETLDFSSDSACETLCCVDNPATSQRGDWSSQTMHLKATECEIVVKVDHIQSRSLPVLDVLFAEEPYL